MEEIGESNPSNRQISWETLVALREAFNLSYTKPSKATYSNVLDLLSDISPSVYDRISKDVELKNLSDEAKLFVEEANALSSNERIIDPVELIDKEIQRYRDSMEKGEGRQKFLAKKIGSLEGAKKSLLPRKISENRILQRDFFMATQKFGGLLKEKLYINENTVDYSLPNSHKLRMRLIHPDNEEKILGVDMIYEIFDMENELVRFVQMQYKRLVKETLSLNDERMMKQIGRMEKNLCKSNYCRFNHQEKYSPNYRLPYCCGFLRPTSEIQPPDVENSTIGWHIPICEVLRVSDQKSLTRGYIGDKSISTPVFEELFRSNMIGSRWIKIEELENFYSEKGLLDLANTVRIHAQEVKIKKSA